MQIEAIFLFFDPSTGGRNVAKKSRGIFGISSASDTEYAEYLAYPEPRRHGLLERPIIKVMATFQVDFRVARSERPPPDPRSADYGHEGPRHFTLRPLSVLSLPSLYPEQE